MDWVGGPYMEQDRVKVKGLLAMGIPGSKVLGGEPRVQAPNAGVGAAAGADPDGVAVPAAFLA